MAEAPRVVELQLHGVAEEMPLHVSLCSSETEDEEIKLGCLAGQQTFSDFECAGQCASQSAPSSTPQSHSSDGDIEDDQEDDISQGVVSFVGDQVQLHSPKLFRPKPSPATAKRVISVDEQENYSQQDSKNVSLPCHCVPFLVNPQGLSGILAWHDDGYGAESSNYNSEEDEEEFVQETKETGSDSDEACSLNNTNEEPDSGCTSGSKRILSISAFDLLNEEERCQSKRFKFSDLDETTFIVVPPRLSPSTVCKVIDTREHRQSTPILSSSDEEELDRQLGWELEAACEDDGSGQSPVPLLTPPSSPLTVQVDGLTTTVCEWPSNLAIDSAMAAVKELRPLSPTSLEDLEREEEERGITFSTQIQVS